MIRRMALSLTATFPPRAVPAPSSSSRQTPRRPDLESRLGAAARCLDLMLAERGAMGARWRSPGFAEGVERVRAELIPIVSTDALADSYAREASRGDAVEAAYALRWLELTTETIRPAWPALVGVN
jgi:hypothetical protein